MRTYKLVAYKDDHRWLAGFGFKSIADAEKVQRRFYAKYIGVDFYIE